MSRLSMPFCLRMMDGANDLVPTSRRKRRELGKKLRNAHEPEVPFVEGGLTCWRD
jgi:hypothetical protein